MISFAQNVEREYFYLPCSVLSIFMFVLFNRQATYHGMVVEIQALLDSHAHSDMGMQCVVVQDSDRCSTT
jgi:hypothetical protein